MVELVDTQDLGSCAFGREGSSPFFGTLRHRRATAETGGLLYEGSPVLSFPRPGELAISPVVGASFLPWRVRHRPGLGDLVLSGEVR